MAILQIDGKGNIKGGGKFSMKVKILSPVRIKGVSCPVGSVVELEGNVLAFLLGQQKAEPFIEDYDPALNEKPVEMPNAQCSISNEKPEQLNNEPKKIGPKRKKKTN